MKVEQIYTNCLAQGSYYIENQREVAIIDPLREVQEYIDLAESRNAKIKYIFETHFHADFVSGHLTLSEMTGAPIIYGPLAETDFASLIAKDGQEFELGNVKIKAIHTPGHTMESTCYLLFDSENKPHSLFSGDTLFLGDVGRPDLAQKAGNMTQEDLAGILFDSLRNKIMTLPDSVVVYPGHGAGSACGKNMSKETVGLLGEQKQGNYALRSDMTKEEFVLELTEGLLPPPAYFPLNVHLNKSGYDSIYEVITRGKTPIAPKDLLDRQEEHNAFVLDVRNQDQYSQGHISGSIFIGLDGQFAPWVGALIQDIKKKIILVVDESRLQEAITRLSRVGFDGVVGYLDGGIEAWKKEGFKIDTVDSITAEELSIDISKTNYSVFDVRKIGEYDSEHLEKVNFVTLDEVETKSNLFPNDEGFYVHCAGGYRSMIALSILKSKGINGGINILGGFGAIKKTNLPIQTFECQGK
ncbi:MAG: hydroxyacylglutathione hydrolase [Lentimonas sp.]|jgi:hydroxyacylglutathione hydrolase